MGGVGGQEVEGGRSIGPKKNMVGGGRLIDLKNRWATGGDIDEVQKSVAHLGVRPLGHVPLA